MAKYNKSNLTKAHRASLVEIFGVDLEELAGEVTLVTKGEARVQRECYCGCGRMTYGTWFPGDDSIYKSGLLAVSRGKRTPEPGSWDNMTPEEALAELTKLEAEAKARKEAKANRK
jgi:hypothetical protein